MPLLLGKPVSLPCHMFGLRLLFPLGNPEAGNLQPALDIAREGFVKCMISLRPMINVNELRDE